MNEVAVKVENLWKQYRIGHKGSTSFRESIGQLFTKSEKDYFWALKELNFEIKQGEAVGIIGKNGAGKSTLLKVLSKITYPTKGFVEINGRVSSLLEVGTGFHPELSGRQNVYLNGTILGMSRREINAKFDEIVAFSGVEKFIDTAVKHYSSGMKVRLAFSVAAHLEPEILIIDEVLAVGDAEFQKKCLGKMEDVTGEGRTVLFVSHNMSAVETLCNRVIEIRTGNLYSDGNNVLELIGDYLTSGISGDSNNENCQWINKEDDLFLNEYHTFHKISLVDERENVFKGIIPASAPIYLNISMSIKRHDPSLNIGYAIYKNGEPLYWSWMKDEQGDFTDLKENISVTLQTVIPPHFLSRGEYVIEIFSVLDKIKILVKKGEGVRIPFEIEGSFAEVRLHPKFEWLIKEK